MLVVTPAEAISGREVLSVHDREGPTPAGEFAGNSDIGDNGSLLPRGELDPLMVQPYVSRLTAELRFHGALAQWACITDWAVGRWSRR